MLGSCSKKVRSESGENLQYTLLRTLNPTPIVVIYAPTIHIELYSTPPICSSIRKSKNNMAVLDLLFTVINVIWPFNF